MRYMGILNIANQLTYFGGYKECLFITGTESFSQIGSSREQLNTELSEQLVRFSVALYYAFSICSCYTVCRVGYAQNKVVLLCFKGFA